MNEVHIRKIAAELKVQPDLNCSVEEVARRVSVTVTEVELPHKRIALSMKAAPQLGPATTGPHTSPAGTRPPGGGSPRPGQPAQPAPVDWFTAALNQHPKH